MTETNLPSMRDAVLGTGPVALGSAALLLSPGHVPTLWSPKFAEAASLEQHAGAALQLSATVTVAATCADAVASAEAVLIAVPATAYRAVLDQVAVNSADRLMEALDAERLAIAKAFGAQVRTLRQHFHLSLHAPEAPLGEMARTQAAAGDDPAAPTCLDTRSVPEDAPFGLYPTTLLGRLRGRPAALHEAGLLTLSAPYGRDLAKENDIVPVPRLTELSVDELRGLTGEGSAP